MRGTSALGMSFYGLRPRLRAFARLALARYNFKTVAFKITFFLITTNHAGWRLKGRPLWACRIWACLAGEPILLLCALLL